MRMTWLWIESCKGTSVIEGKHFWSRGEEEVLVINCQFHAFSGNLRYLFPPNTTTPLSRSLTQRLHYPLMEYAAIIGPCCCIWQGAAIILLCVCVSPAAFLKALICMQRGWEPGKHTFCPRPRRVTMAAPRKCINIYGKGTKKSKDLCLSPSQFIPLFINLILEQLLGG